MSADKNYIVRKEREERKKPSLFSFFFFRVLCGQEITRALSAFLYADLNFLFACICLRPYRAAAGYSRIMNIHECPNTAIQMNNTT
jgi:hypothetical protein